MKSDVPNFLIIGAAKAGTTALYIYLRQHPQIHFAPLKEPSYFAYGGQPLSFAGRGDLTALQHCTTTNLTDYQAQFAGIQSELASGEASTAYLYHPQVAQRIYDHNPQMRLLVMLRQPADRAYAAYLHLRRDGREPCETFADALAQEPIRIAGNWEQLWHYTQMGFYTPQLQRYLALFPPEQIQIHLFDDLQDNPLAVLESICRFLGVDDAFPFQLDARPNVSGIPRWVVPAWLQQRLKQLIPHSRGRQWLLGLYQRSLSKPEMPADVHQQLTDLFRPDILQLQALLQRDLSGWLM